MSCRGVLFAINPKTSKKLKSFSNDEELVEYIQENIEEEWDEELLIETDKAWDAIHRCFANGELELSGGEHPLNSIIFGGEILNTEADYFVSLKNNTLVKEIAEKIGIISKEKLSELYYKISNSYQGEKNKEDFEYTWNWFEGIKDFYIKIAKTNMDIIFTVDQ
jgi:hypothetical protein